MLLSIKTYGDNYNWWSDYKKLNSVTFNFFFMHATQPLSYVMYSTHYVTWLALKILNFFEICCFFHNILFFITHDLPLSFSLAVN